MTRIQCDVYIGRPGPFGNPFLVDKDGTREEVIEKFRHYFYTNSELRELVWKELRGKTLGCWCVPKRCHGHVYQEYIEEREHTELLEILNECYE